jgi:hypothetical protein
MEHSDLKRCDRISEQYEGENYQVRYNSAQRWYYFSKQQLDEILVFMSYDNFPGTDAECEFMEQLLPSQG